MSSQTVLWSLFIISISLLNVESAVISLGNLYENEHDVKAAQCGGAIVSDSDFLTYPRVGDPVVPGEVCVWTIHLETLNEFRFNFTDFDVSSSTNGSESDCSSGGVRIYSLSNLNLVGDDLKSYTFCNEIPPTTDFLLGGNVVAVAFYASSYNQSNGSGFTLSWEGTAIDRMRTKHLSTYAMTPSAEIRYPIKGGYETNLAATWLVKADVPERKVDFVLNSILLESCGIPQDRCACDALILYEISDAGKISEARRFCEDSTDEILSGISSNFILGFFTDFETQLGSQGGFDTVYYATSSNVTTTRPNTTTTEPSTPEVPVVATECGGILVGNSGTIRYKLNVTYDTHERCVWTVRAPESTRITFRVIEGVLAFSDNIHILALQKASANETFYESPPRLSLRGDTVTVNGSVAVVVFSSYYLILKNGFELEFEGNQVGSNGISSSSQDLIFTSEVSGAKYIYPGPPTEAYGSNELSTIVLAPPSYKVDHGVMLYNNFYQDGLADYGNGCEDYVTFFYYSYYDGFTTPRTFCSYDKASYLMENSDFMVVVFQSNSKSTGGLGFQLDWTWDYHCSTPFCGSKL